MGNCLSHSYKEDKHGALVHCPALRDSPERFSTPNRRISTNSQRSDFSASKAAQLNKFHNNNSSKSLNGLQGYPNNVKSPLALQSQNRMDDFCRANNAQASLLQNQRLINYIDTHHSRVSEETVVGREPLYSTSPTELVALFNYTARTQEELSLSKQDIMVVLNNNDPEWWFVEHAKTRTKGYIPSSYVAAKGTLEAESWYIPKLSRKDSERLLLMKGNGRGTFLIRASETTQGTLTLSVRDREREKPVDGQHSSVFHEIVKHYHVRQMDNGGYYITSKRKFTDLNKLVEFYSAAPNGLACRLVTPCPRPAPVTSDLSVLTKDHWEIPQKSIFLIEKLGAGQFGDVWRAKWNNTTEVAVKTLKPGTMTKEEFLKEARIMKSARHPRLVRLYAVCLEEPIYIIFELMPGGSLLNYLRHGPGQKLDLSRLVDMMAQIAQGMAYLEKERFIHRDLAARNILVGDNNIVKVADFGLARMVEDRYETYMAQKGTKFPIKWTAPEAALKFRFTIKSDVWSFGIVLYEIITFGQQPYPSMGNAEALQRISEGYRMPQPSRCPDPIYAIMLDTWDADPEKRPTFAYLCEFFEEYFTSSNETNYRFASAMLEPSPPPPGRAKLLPKSSSPLAVI